MKEFLINHLEYRVFDSRKDQLKNNSLYHSELKDNEVLFEIVEEKGGVKKLVGFRIYSKDIVNDNNVSSLVDEIIKDGGYFSERIDKKYVYISRFDGFYTIVKKRKRIKRLFGVREMKMWINGYDSKRIHSLAERIRHTGDLTNNVAKLLIAKCDSHYIPELAKQLKCTKYITCDGLCYVLTNDIVKLLIKKCDMSRRQDLEEQLIRCEEPDYF